MHSAYRLIILLIFTAFLFWFKLIHSLILGSFDSLYFPSSLSSLSSLSSSSFKRAALDSAANPAKASPRFLLSLLLLADRIDELEDDFTIGCMPRLTRLCNTLDGDLSSCLDSRKLSRVKDSSRPVRRFFATCARPGETSPVCLPGVPLPLILGTGSLGASCG